MTATLQQVCARAAELIRQRGWWRGPADGGDGESLCLVLALEEASDSLGVASAYDHDAIARRIGLADNASLVDWNDAQPSAEPVLALLDQIAGEP